MLDYHIRLHNLRHKSEIPDNLSKQIKDDIEVYIINLHKLKSKLTLLSDRSESLYKIYFIAPALSLRGGKRSKSFSKNIKRKS